MTEAQKVRQLILELLNISGGLSMSTEKLVTEVRLAGFDHRQVEAELETLSALGYVLRLPPSPLAAPLENSHRGKGGPAVMTTVRTAAAAISRMAWPGSRMPSADVWPTVEPGVRWHPCVPRRDTPMLMPRTSPITARAHTRTVSPPGTFGWPPVTAMPGKWTCSKNTRKREALRKPDWRLPWTCWKAHLTAWTCPTSKP